MITIRVFRAHGVLDIAPCERAHGKRERREVTMPALRRLAKI